MPKKRLNTLPRPYTRTELYLDGIIRNKNIQGMPLPYTRTEQYLYYILKNGIAGGGGGGVPFVGLTGANLVGNQIIFDKSDGTTIPVNLSDFVNKSSDNTFTGKNIFNELSLGLPNKTNYIIQNGNYGEAVTQIKTGNRAITSHSVASSNGYVKSLVARVDNVKIGDKVNVNIWEVTKGADRSQDVPKLLRSNIEVDVIPKDGYFNGGNAIKCPINKKYDKDTYFIFQLLGNAKVFRAANINPPSDDYIRIEENVHVTTAAIEASRDNLVGVYLLELGDVNIIDLISSSSGSAGTGTVTTVNRQPSDVQGNVTVNAEHINTQAGITVQEALDNKVDITTLDDYITEIDADRKYVQQTQVGNAPNLIPQLNQEGKLVGSIIPELSITRVQTVATEQDALAKINDDTANGLQTGDVVVITQNNNSIYMYNGTGTQVFKDNFIELSIGDGTVKVINNQRPTPNGEVIINSDHISYNNQASNLQSNNVKDAIDELNRKFVSNIRYESADRSLHQTIDGSDTKIVDGIVTKWGDLEHVTQSRLKNIFDKNTQVEENKRYFFDHIEVNPDWKIAKIPCQAGDEFTVIKSVDNDSSQMGLFEAGDINIQNINANHKSVKGRRVYHFTIPSSATNAAYFVISMKNDVTNIDEVMVFKENVVDGDIPTNYIPFSDGASVIINSNEVALTFDKTGTSLSSATIHSAIKELDRKIITTTGSVASINGQNGAITLSMDNSVDEIQFSVNGNKVSSIPYPTQNEIDTLKARLNL